MRGVRVAVAVRGVRMAVAARGRLVAVDVRQALEQRLDWNADVGGTVVGSDAQEITIVGIAEWHS